MKKIILCTLVLVLSFQLIASAAIGGTKSRRIAPSSKPPTTQTAPSKSSDYKPSAPAKSYNEKAPEAKQANPQTAQSMSQQTNTGGFLRNLGMFGGGMLLGGMLSSLFGFGAGGMFAQMIDMLIAMMLFMGVLMAGRYAWNKLTNKRKM
ncbi:hypothetical protein P22_0980 [Propionispora sp. 2/2-37]|uniref:hypothetical protein n=1 Tax=Propionispora sp. 2/2-37 TaxID=1677858 RepID=UPI0006BB8F9F|nr:hypothetical protein [Propionispora sp. 2/2-37]CUH94911.1 hypothetical protein P22_0980 [Propionispora sp. 2/2-37]